MCGSTLLPSKPGEVPERLVGVPTKTNHAGRHRIPQIKLGLRRSLQVKRLCTHLQLEMTEPKVRGRISIPDGSVMGHCETRGTGLDAEIASDVIRRRQTESGIN